MDSSLDSSQSNVSPADVMLCCQQSLLIPLVREKPIRTRDMACDGRAFRVSTCGIIEEALIGDCIVGPKLED